MLDMRDALATDDETELADTFEAFDMTATDDKPNASLELAATRHPETRDRQEKATAHKARSRNSYIAGAGFEQTSATAPLAYRLVEMHRLA